MTVQFQLRNLVLNLLMNSYGLKVFYGNDEFKFSNCVIVKINVFIITMVLNRT